MSAAFFNHNSVAAFADPEAGQDIHADSAIANSPVVSIVMPAYNGSRFMRESVASIQSQTFTRWELIIVNDGSSDGTGDLADRLAAADARIRVVHQVNGGLPNARNSGVEASDRRSEYITFIDADDLWAPETLESLVGVLADRQDLSGAHAVGRYVDDNNRPIRPGELESWQRMRLQVSTDLRRRVTIPRDAPTTFEMLSMRNYIPAGTVVFRRADFERAGRFDERLKSVEDWHMWMRIASRKPIGFVDRVLFSYRRHDANMSGDTWRMRREHFRAAKDLYDNCDLDPIRRRHFLRSQTIPTHLLWACDHASHGRIGATANHLCIAVRNLVEYHLAPRLFRREREDADRN
jgi:glycosyltransferase involved in cell wall biosynthesis